MAVADFRQLRKQPTCSTIPRRSVRETCFRDAWVGILGLVGYSSRYLGLRHDSVLRKCV